MKEIKLGIIGYGSRIYNVMRYICKLHQEVNVVAIADPRHKEIDAENQNLTETRLIENFGKKYKEIEYYSNADEMLKRDDLDGIVIGTNCNTHTELAIKAFKKIFLFF